MNSLISIGVKPQDWIDISFINKQCPGYIYTLSRTKENLGRRRYPGEGNPDRNNPDFRTELVSCRGNSGGLW